MGQAIDLYVEYLGERGRRESSCVRARRHLVKLFSDQDEALADVTPRRAAELYLALRTGVNKHGAPIAVDTHRNALNEAGTFARWAVKRRLLAADPFAEVEPIGKRKRGKPQLRLDEARKLIDATLPEVEGGDLGALVVALLLLTGLRATEAATIESRDVDDGGHLLWVSTSKTEAGLRRLAIPEVLAGPLKRAAKGGRIFPDADRWWVGRMVARWTKAAGVPSVSPHGLRGTHSTIATEHGATGPAVAGALGQNDRGVTAERHYIAPGTSERAQARRAWKVLEGGRS